MWQDTDIVSTYQPTWTDAITYCANLSLEGYDDWRLPSILELMSIVDFSNEDYRLNSVFQSHESVFWSSTSVNTEYAQSFDFEYALNGTNSNSSYKTQSGFSNVRCVRNTD